MFALLATGCGGDAAAEFPPVDPAAATPDPNAALVTEGGSVTEPLRSSGDEGAPGANEISSADATVGKSVKVSAATPKGFRAAHCSKPIMVVYHQPGSIVDEKLLAEGRAAAASVKGVVSLEYTPRDVKASGDLPAKLGLFATPGVATVGRDGRIENFWTTYVDRALIQRSLRNAAASRPCKVSSGEVPAAGSAIEAATTVANGGAVDAVTSADPASATTPVDPTVDAAGAAAGALPVA